MSRNPRLTGIELIAALRKPVSLESEFGAATIFLRHEDGRQTIVPVHSSEIIGPTWQ